MLCDLSLLIRELAFEDRFELCVLALDSCRYRLTVSVPTALSLQLHWQAIMDFAHSKLNLPLVKVRTELYAEINDTRSAGVVKEINPRIVCKLVEDCSSAIVYNTRTKDFAAVAKTTWGISGWVCKDSSSENIHRAEKRVATTHMRESVQLAGQPK